MLLLRTEHIFKFVILNAVLLILSRCDKRFPCVLIAKLVKKQFR